MTAKKLTAILEKLGFGIAHARRMPRSDEIRAYVAIVHPEHADCDEFRWTPERPGEVDAYEHATRPNGYTRYDKFVARFTIADLID